MRVRTYLAPEVAVVTIQRFVRRVQDKAIEDFLRQLAKETGKRLNVKRALQTVRDRRQRALASYHVQSPTKSVTVLAPSLQHRKLQNLLDFQKYFIELYRTKSQRQGKGYKKKKYSCQFCQQVVKSSKYAMQLHLLRCKKAIQQHSGRLRLTVANRMRLDLEKVKDKDISYSFSYECRHRCGFICVDHNEKSKRDTCCTVPSKAKSRKISVCATIKPSAMLEKPEAPVHPTKEVPHNTTARHDLKRPQSDLYSMEKREVHQKKETEPSMICTDTKRRRTGDPKQEEVKPEDNSDQKSTREREEEELKTGVEVRAQWSSGKRWYIATVHKVNGDGTFYLLYNDGGIWPHCPASKIMRKPNDVKPRKKSTMSKSRSK